MKKIWAISYLIFVISMLYCYLIWCNTQELKYTIPAIIMMLSYIISSVSKINIENRKDEEK